MNILLLGSTGMAGAAISEFLKSQGISVTGIARKNADYNCDISIDSSLVEVLSMQKYGAIINAAANVNIEFCEKNPLESWAVNAKPLLTLAKWSEKFDKPLLHISTDHFFPYGGNKAHTEKDRVYIRNEYARQKYAAERYALAARHSLVIRTSILGTRSSGDQGLTEWAVGELSNRRTINLFGDAWTSSIDVQSFARFSWTVFFEKKHRGLLNLAAREVYSKAAFIRCIAGKLGLDHGNCVSASVKDTFANHPNCLGLDVSNAEEILGEKLPTMEEVCNQLSADEKLIKLSR